MLEEACRAVAWPRPAGTAGGRPLALSVAVNVSPVQLNDAGFVGLVRSTLAATGLAPERLVLEVTEHVVLRRPRAAVKRLRALRSLGVRVALDDFGTGCSSFASLKALPLDILKVDRSFVAGLCVAPVDHAQALRLEVVAEGVETVEQASELRRLGCSHAQGHLYGRAAPWGPYGADRPARGTKHAGQGTGLHLAAGHPRPGDTVPTPETGPPAGPQAVVGRRRDVAPPKRARLLLLDDDERFGAALSQCPAMGGRSRAGRPDRHGAGRCRARPHVPVRHRLGGLPTAATGTALGSSLGSVERPRLPGSWCSPRLIPAWRC